MFAVYRVDGDGCSYSYDTLLFVTASEQTAEDAVALAELELEAALAVPFPTYSSKDLQKNGAQWVADLHKAYAEKIKSICTMDPPEYNCHSKEVCYYYEKVEVR
jgi:hypothetical protein